MTAGTLCTRILLLITLGAASARAQDASRNTWGQQYKERTAQSMAEQFEQPSRPVYRYRAAIAALLALKEGMSVAEVGAGSGFLSRLLAQQVGPAGRVFATELEPKMVAYMNDRARAEGLKNFVAVQGQPASTELGAASVDTIAIVNAYSFFDQPRAMLRSAADALRAGGTLLIVDVPRMAEGAKTTGVDAEDVVAAAAAAGFERLRESSVVPGQYAITFRKR